MRSAVVLAVALALAPRPAAAGWDEAARDALAALEKSGKPVLVSRCEKREKAGLYRATLVMGHGADKALLIETADGEIVNLASIAVGAMGLKLEETEGGVYSYDRVTKLIAELAADRFELAAPFRAGDLEKKPVPVRCRRGMD